ncbi:hypothetical protein [Reinekea sp. G2M2-21]|uniref:hypothetical protein n=1 Tax=Reinekea sp. G2M2-21 TaxID=2788942 RepID=UPI0018A8A6D8|nr:hypothetical protein [Reinekea sp. G2M2-21]
MKHAFTVSLTAALITACAGGNSPEVIKPDLGGGDNVGQLTAGSQPFDIDGLGFKTATVNAKSIDGQFSYNDGEQITFMLGDTELFTVAAAENLNFSTALRQGYALPDTADAVLSILETPPGQAAATLDPLHVISNKMKLLLVLDNDRNPDNGIDLTDWHQRLAGTFVDLDHAFDRPDVFVDTFSGSLAAPVAIDIAEPLVTLYDMEGIKVRAPRMIQHESAWSSLEYINSYQYNSLGALTQTDNLVRRTSTDKDLSRDTITYSLDKFGFPQEVITTQRLNLDTDTPETYVAKTVLINNGYMGRNGYQIVTFEEDFNGTSLDDLELEYRMESTYSANQPIRMKEFSDNGNQTTSQHDYVYQYDSEGREIQERMDYISHDDTGAVIETVTNLYTTVYSTVNGDEVTSRSDDRDNDGVINSRKEIRIKRNSEGQVLEKESSYYGTDDLLTFRRQQNFEYNDNGKAIQEIELRDLDKDGLDLENEYGVKIDTYNDQGVLVEQSRTSNSNNTNVTKTVTKYSYEEQGTTLGRMKSIVQTEQTWAYGTAEADRPEPHRVITYNYVYDANSGRLTNINSNQIYNGVENYRQTIELAYNADGNLTDYTITYNVDDIGGTARVMAHHMTYVETDNGLGYLLHNQTREQLNSLLNKTAQDYDIYLNTPVLIFAPWK